MTRRDTADRNSLHRGDKHRHDDHRRDTISLILIAARVSSRLPLYKLRPYGEAARRRADGGPVALVLLTAAPDEAERRNRAWQPVRWFALLRRWEAVLAAADDISPAFARLRARLWHALLINPGALR